jgi:deazaflavin-dependent oxidoreductase (nitroreductase family)
MPMSPPATKETFQRPNVVERVFNRLFGVIVGLGGGLEHNYVLQVRGRKSGRLCSTPVNLLEMEQSQYLVAPRGNTQWVRNVRSSLELSLKKGAKVHRFRARELIDSEKPVLLKEYLSRYHKTVQRYFSIPMDSDLGSFAKIANRHPIFELERTHDTAV